ncbi:MAG: NADH-quinone oxidoreductase subunit J, partial [Chloroflexota bacterium]
MELALFFLLALTAIVSAAGMIYQKNAVHSALFLILNFGCVALLFLMLDAPFISMVQIAVYAGAIMVLFLFVIMLLGAEQTTDTDARQFGWVTQAATVLGAAFLFALAGSPLQ